MTAVPEKPVKRPKVLHGVIAEVISTTLSYPLNTLKTNSQVLKTIKPTLSNLTRGFKYSLATEVVNSLIFYSLFEKLPFANPFIRSSLGSTLAIAATYPLNVKRKLAQVGKCIKVKNLYSGLQMGILNGVPGISINFTVRELLKTYSPPILKPFSGLLSTSLSIALTHPLDTISTHIATRTPLKI